MTYSAGSSPRLDGLGTIVEARDYSATETLRDGRSVEIRTLRPEDRASLLASVVRTSKESLYRRFFGFRRGFTDREIDLYLDVDFVSHVALVAVLKENGQPVIVGEARYVVVQPGQAEVAFAVDDPHQGHGIGTALMRHLVAMARQAGLKELIAEVLPENTVMLRVFETSGLGIRTRREPDAIHVVLQLS
jgi:RimJ/RimL family protein N-acetyltransferase